MTRLARVAAFASLLFVCAVFVDARQADAQVVTSYYAPAPAVSYMPVRRGIFGWRVGYRPVVSYAAPTIVAPPVATYYRAPVVAAPTIVAPPVTTYYRAPLYYRAPPLLPRRAYYAPAPRVYVYP